MTDPGLARERTWLAWWRTLLVAAGVAILAARMASLEGAPLFVATALAGWTALFVVAFGRYRSRRAEPGPALPCSRCSLSGMRCSARCWC
ncbi:DUF202 domain-containing protein [Phytohabitans flavus]|uniref:DUF202 domain-containing protein n=1 Tax=Phytohabitans flavus TaxID=1076124 RepID=UPI0036309A51